MNVNAPEGVLEAIANRSLLEYVRSTDIADVSILPVGSAQTLHASTLSPAALRRLIDEAKKHFDTILIDTGPILGSIEASLGAAPPPTRSSSPSPAVSSGRWSRSRSTT